MPFRLGFKSIFLLLTTLTVANIFFVKPLMNLGLSQPMSLSICTTLAVAISMTCILSFSKQIDKAKKKKALPYFGIFVALGIFISILAIY
ncbi:hypothetical protein [Risungbinella massiliensis]|uniref:hypothetical protein n=1 Tax=Risungbinella massiliensis TaxID=1329796 RepID=UPI0005CB8632|nr:hypothetical protein [Risungbinella massiliensis]